MRDSVGVLVLVATARMAFHVATNGQYGFHRDELQTLDDARHLDWGFVAYPPITPLIGRLESAPPAIQEEICIALDLIHNPAAIPALSRVLKARRSFWSRVPLFTEAVRVRAASGLAHFLGEPPARLALETAAKDSSPLVRQIALQILHQNP